MNGGEAGSRHIMRGEITTHQGDRTPALTLDDFHSVPPGTRVHAFCIGGVQPHGADTGGSTRHLDGLDQVDGVTLATRLRNDEHTSQPRGQMGPLVQIMSDQTGGSDRLVINQQHEGLWRARWGHRRSHGITE